MKKLLLCLILISWLAPAQAQKKRKIDSFKIDKLDILQFPTKKPNGECWDNDFSACYADVYPQIRNTVANVNIEKARIENLQTLPSTFAHALWGSFSQKAEEQTVYIDFYDYDSISKPDYIGTVAFKPEDYLKDKTVKIDNQTGIVVILHLNWYASQEN
ncbi:MAG: hypothetical protein MUE85_21590 [Microscillaceae bacterium]|jgi:hypothetical protein|nr:hypothetical protein [Microscillaceae bacterium]